MGIWAKRICDLSSGILLLHLTHLRDVRESFVEGGIAVEHVHHKYVSYSQGGRVFVLYFAEQSVCLHGCGGCVQCVWHLQP